MLTTSEVNETLHRFQEEIEEILTICRLHAYPAGSWQDLTDLPLRLSQDSGFRSDFSEIVRSMQREGLNLPDVLEVITAAIGGSTAPGHQRELREQLNWLGSFLSSIGRWPGTDVAPVLAPGEVPPTSTSSCGQEARPLRTTRSNRTRTSRTLASRTLKRSQTLRSLSIPRTPLPSTMSPQLPPPQPRTPASRHWPISPARWLVWSAAVSSFELIWTRSISASAAWSRCSNPLLPRRQLRPSLIPPSHLLIQHPRRHFANRPRKPSRSLQRRLGGSLTCHRP